jgi:hypothetical protein
MIGWSFGARLARRIALLSPLALLALTACVTSPESHTSITTGAHQIDFEGLAQYKSGLQVVIQGHGVKGAFQDLAIADVTKDNHWAVTVSLPKTLLNGPCTTGVFRAVTKPGGAVLKATDRACIDALPANASAAQIQACSVDQIVLSGGTTVNGNLTLNGSAAAAPYQCVTKVNGNLTIAGGRVQVNSGTYQPGLTFALPNLTQVGGNLTIDGDRAESVSLPQLASVGGDLSLSMTHFVTVIPPAMPGGSAVFDFPATDIALPLLASIGGSVDLFDARDNAPVSSASFPYDFKLDALTSLGGSVRVHNSVFPAAIKGLNSLTTIHGDVLIDWGSTDLDSSTLLAGVTHIEGNFELDGPPNSRHLMAGLTTIDGNATIQAESGSNYARLGHNLLEGLTHVGGDMFFDKVDSGMNCASVFYQLTQVGGGMFVTNSRNELRFGATGGAHLSLGSFHLSDSDMAVIPLNADAAVAPTGAIEVTNNADPCSCQVDAFIASQQSAGWLGAATNTGNGSGAACTTCPDTFCP